MHDIMNVILPKAIFEDRRVTRTSKLVYFGLRAHPKTNIKGCAENLNMPYQTVQQAIQQLRKLDWVYSYRAPQTGRVIQVPSMPFDVEVAVSDAFEQRLETVSNRGESLMKGWLDYLVDDPKFLDNHRFKWAVSPDGTVYYEYDRAYPEARVVIEFQGRQHFQTVQFRDGESNLQEQMARDRAKMLACERNEFAYVEIADIELSWETIRQKLDGLLPLLQPREDRPLFRKLDQLSKGYAEWARRRR